jgi:formamidopyrimidine-DNA glycosylase
MAHIMPELPEVETVRRGLEPAMVGARFTGIDQRRADLRFPFPERFVERLNGRRVEGLGRRAKYILVTLDDTNVLVMHLGMSGSFRIEEGVAGNFHHARRKDAAHDHVVFRFSNGTTVTYNDPRRFGFMQIVPTAELTSHPLFANIGIEPLGNEFSGEVLARFFAGKSVSLKTALLDQTLIAGLGNIYVCEALHRASLSPRRGAATLARRDGTATERAHLLAATIRQVLEEALVAGGSSLRDHQRTDGTLGYFQHSFRVYDRENEACLKEGCGGVVRRIVQSGRSTFFCNKCQK